MKKSVNPFMVFAFLCFCVTLLHGVGCKKEADKEYECRTCQAFGIDGVEDEEEVCSEAEETAFRNDNPGKQITCE